MLLASCDAVGGDSRQLGQWIAMPELMHVASLMIGAGIRGESGAAMTSAGQVNAGCMCLCLLQQLLDNALMTPDIKAAVHEQFSQASRAMHTGQAMHIVGLEELILAAIQSGDTTELEEALLCTYRLKTATPAACFSQMVCRY